MTHCSSVSPKQSQRDFLCNRNLLVEEMKKKAMILGGDGKPKAEGA